MFTTQLNMLCRQCAKGTTRRWFFKFEKTVEERVSQAFIGEVDFVIVAEKDIKSNAIQHDEVASLLE